MNLKERIESELEHTSLQIFIKNQMHLDMILNKLVKLDVFENAEEFKKYTLDIYDIKSLVLRKFATKRPRVYYSLNEEQNPEYKLITDNYLSLHEIKYKRKRLNI